MVRDPFANANDEHINGLLNRLTQRNFQRLLLSSNVYRVCVARVDELKELNDPKLSDIIKNLEDMADTHHRQEIKAKFIADSLPGLVTIFWPKLEGQEQRDRILNELFSQADEGSWDAAFVKSLNAWLKDCIKAAASHCDYAKLCNNMNPHKRKGSSSRSDTPFVPNKKGKGGKGGGVTSATIGSAPLDSAVED